MGYEYKTVVVGSGELKGILDRLMASLTASYNSELNGVDELYTDDRLLGKYIEWKLVEDLGDSIFMEEVPSLSEVLKSSDLLFDELIDYISCIISDQLGLSQDTTLLLYARLTGINTIILNLEIENEFQ